MLVQPGRKFKMFLFLLRFLKDATGEQGVIPVVFAYHTY